MVIQKIGFEFWALWYFLSAVGIICIKKSEFCLRIDKYLSSVNLVKRRTIAQDMVKSGVVFINGTLAKPSKDVKEGDRIEIRYFKGPKLYRVLKIPTTKTIPKSAKDQYVEEIS